MKLLGATLFALFTALGITKSAGRGPPGAGQCDACETYFIPLDEDDLLDTFLAVDTSPAVQGGIRTTITISVAHDDTIIYYDHWEDGYDTGPCTNPFGTTQTWGDGDPSNGIPPGASTTDTLNAGTVIVLESLIDIPKDPSRIQFDGKDQIRASSPITITRTASPDTPGRILTGAVEVLSTKTNGWGERFVAPVGEGMALDVTGGFEMVQWYAMADDPGTLMFLNGVPLPGTGSSRVISNIQLGDTLISSAPIQVHLLATDEGRARELRWYSQTVSNSWSYMYMLPVAEWVGSTAYWIYNPDPTQVLTVTYSGAKVVPGSFSVPPGQVVRPTIRDFTVAPAPFNIILSTRTRHSGIKFEGNRVFYGLVQVDADGSGGIFDWGFPFIPIQELSSRVLVGAGNGCANNNNCGGTGSSRSVIWVTADTDCECKIDADGDGVFERNFVLAALDALRIDNDAAGTHDLSGAFIVCSNSDGQPVKIAVAWGLDPSLSFSGDRNRVDMGAAVVPLGKSCPSSCPRRPDQDNYFEDYAAVLGRPNALKCCTHKPNPPSNGRRCTPRGKICLWGEQICPDGSFHPTTRCDCPVKPNNQWSCVPVVCP